MLTPSQLGTLKTAVIADPVAGPLLAAGDTYSLLSWLNAPSATLAWRTDVPPQSSDEAATYTTYDSLVAGKRDSWSIFLGFSRNFTKAKIRNWVIDIWGNATAGSVAEAILQAGTAFATNAQAVFGGTSRTTGSVTALNMNYAGLITQEECSRLVA